MFIMARKKIFNSPESRVVYAEKEDFLFLKSKGYPVASFFRQALEAHKAGKWEFKFI